MVPGDPTHWGGGETEDGTIYIYILYIILYNRYTNIHHTLPYQVTGRLTGLQGDLKEGRIGKGVAGLLLPGFRRHAADGSRST